MVRTTLALALLSTGLSVAACASSPTDDANASADGGSSDDGGASHGDATESDAREQREGSSPSDDASRDASTTDAGVDSASASASDASVSDASIGDSGARDSGATDAGATDTGASDARDSGSVGGIITGGPCMSGAPGAAAYRIRWVQAGSQAQVVYEVDGLPDRSRDHAGVYGYQIGFTSSFVDPFLAQGGLELDSSDFVDLEISTAGVSSITSATLSIYGRSFNTTTSGSFNWQTFTGVGQAPTDFVSNVAPYKWYSADMTTELAPGDANVLVRIKAGPSSGVLVVNRIELCMQAQ